MRIGEATNPGPTMTIAAVNTQSLNAFVDDGRAFSGHAEVLVFTETAATDYVQQKTTKAARMKGRHVAFSSPVGKRTFKDHRDCVTKGESQGAAIISSLPLRKSLNEWPHEIWKTARIADSFLVTGHGLLLVIAIYGCHQGLPDASLRNEELLRAAVDRASQLKCPALILGDLNCDLPTLAIWDDMLQAGWSDAAEVQSLQDGLPVQNTFQDSSRLDYILMNKEARPAFRKFSVLPQDESDHRAVQATFDWELLPEFAKVNRCPRDTSTLDITPTELQEAYVPSACLRHLDSALERADVEQTWTYFCDAFEKAGYLCP